MQVANFIENFSCQLASQLYSNHAQLVSQLAIAMVQTKLDNSRFNSSVGFYKYKFYEFHLTIQLYSYPSNYIAIQLHGNNCQWNILNAVSVHRATSYTVSYLASQLACMLLQHAVASQLAGYSYVWELTKCAATQLASYSYSSTCM